MRTQASDNCRVIRRGLVMPASHGLILDAFCMSKKQTAIFLKGTVIWGFLSYAAKANSDMRFIHSVSKLYAELVLKKKKKKTRIRGSCGPCPLRMPRAVRQNDR